MSPPNPSRRRLTEAEWEAELDRAKSVQAADVERYYTDPKAYPPGWNECRHGCDHSRAGEPEPLRTRTGRRRSWWQRGWKR